MVGVFGVEALQFLALDADMFGVSCFSGLGCWMIHYVGVGPNCVVTQILKVTNERFALHTKALKPQLKP